MNSIVSADNPSEDGVRQFSGKGDCGLSSTSLYRGACYGERCRDSRGKRTSVHTSETCIPFSSYS